jgi:integrase
MKMHTKVEGVPGLFRTPTGYVIRVEARSTASGKLKTVCKRKALPGASEAEARLAIEKLRRQCEQEAASSAPILTTLGELARLWSEERGERRERGKLRAKTVATDARNLKVFILPHLGRVLVKDLAPSHIQQWLRDVEAMKMPAERRDRAGGTYEQTPKPYSEATLANAWRTLRAFMRWVTIRENLPSNPAREILWDIEDAPKSKGRVTLNAGEFAALVRAARHDRDPAALPMILVARDGAMRSSELSGLDVNHYDPTKKVVEVVQSHVEGDVDAPKTEGSARVVHLQDDTVVALERYLEERGLEGVLFPTRVGTRRTPSSVNYVLRRLAKAAGIAKNVTSHALRRTTNNLVRKAEGGGELVARAITGHVTQDMTDHYSEYDREERVSALRAAFRPPGTGTGAKVEEV